MAGEKREKTGKNEVKKGHTKPQLAFGRDPYVRHMMNYPKKKPRRISSNYLLYSMKKSAQSNRDISWKSLSTQNLL
jgi:hypothetical protein